MSRRWATAALAAMLLLAVGAAVRWSARVPVGMALEPAVLNLHVGEEGEVRLVSHERDIATLAFRLHVDEDVAKLVDAGPAQQSVLTGGNAIVLPARRHPGRLEVPGVAVTGGRVFKPLAPIYRFRLRGVGPGTTVLAIDGLTVVDVHDESRSLPVPAVTVSVRAP